MLAPRSIVLIDTMAIKLAHDYGCWNALRKTFQLHSVSKCVEEATRASRKGGVLVPRSYDELGAELTLGTVTELMVTRLTLQVGSQVDINDGEKHLLAYALTMTGAWFLCGPDHGTVRAMEMVSLLGRMVSFEALSKTMGHRLRDLPHHFSEAWLSSRRTQSLLQSIPSAQSAAVPDQFSAVHENRAGSNRP